MAVTYDKLLGKVLLHKHIEADLSGPYVNVSGDTMTGDLDMSLKEIKNFRSEQRGSLPSAGTTGRLIYLTTDDHLYVDTG